MTEAEFHRAAYGTPSGEERVLSPWGSRGVLTGPRAGSSISRAGSRCPPARVRTAPARGACTTSSATAGSGRPPSSPRSRGSSRWSSYPEYSAEFFDGQHYVMKGASAGTAKELIRPSFRNWFRPELSLRLREVQDGGVTMMSQAVRDRPLTAQFAADVRRDLSQYAEAAAVEVPLRRARLEPVRCDLPAAVVSHHASRERGCSRACRMRSSRSIGRADGDDRRAGLRQRREAGAARRGAAGARRVGARAPDRHLAAGDRTHRTAADAAAPFGRGASVDLRGGPAPGGRGASRRRPDAGAAARIQHRQLRYAGGGTRSCAGSARTVAPGDFLLLGADLAKPERDLLLAYDDPLGVTAAFNKNLLVRINNELGGDFDLDDVRAPSRSGTAADQRIEMHLVSRFAQTRPRPGRGDDRALRGGRADLDGELLQVRAGADRCDAARTPASRSAPVDRPRSPASR